MLKLDANDGEGKEALVNGFIKTLAYLSQQQGIKRKSPWGDKE